VLVQVYPITRRQAGRRAGVPVSYSTAKPNQKENQTAIPERAKPPINSLPSFLPSFFLPLLLCEVKTREKRKKKKKKERKKKKCVPNQYYPLTYSTLVHPALNHKWAVR